MAELGCTVRGYDPEVKDVRNPHKNMHFHQGVIADYTDKFDKAQTFQNMLDINGDEDKNITYVKMDIEHNERSVFLQLFTGNILRRIDQIGVEIHAGHIKKLTKHQLMEIFKTNLTIYYKLFHKYGFRYGSLYFYYTY